ncbi:adenylate/guanylate cyclase domain-containing protein [Hwanghaeella grinnelliae]|uniref:Adenylate/guanylate cyclase domain-containing protein n=1 Tax=Hwanghaeella grinnelliae TaxID=2500179 RepID=A0A3S2Z6K3_9PROT|nr:adenylate/guanylate cyclase domain-containing protein [Hwanghaeella grinnelliae]RVU35764.1 adenylate/guanylate cyclase domain-containing protein [Hwanghaeella grinnelliae]
MSDGEDGYRAVRTLLFMDVMEYTRLLVEDERGTISRWRGFVDYVENAVLPRYSGRIVHSLGDGLLLDFDDVRMGVEAALFLQQVIAGFNQGHPESSHFFLRMGMEVSTFEVDGRDVYGRGAMLGARLMSMAGPGECVVSGTIHKQLAPTEDLEIADLGLCYLKHLATPVRAYRVGPPGAKPVVDVSRLSSRLVPSIAVVPFETRQRDGSSLAVGDIVAEEIIYAISRTRQMDVISRLSTRVFRNTDWTPRDLAEQLNVDYVLAGQYRTDGDTITLESELVEAGAERVVWAQRLELRMQDVLQGDGEAIGRIVADLSNSILSHELMRARTFPLPNLQSYSLLLAGVNLLHSPSLEDFMRAHEMLETVAKRVTRQSVPRAWLAKWHVMRTHQGWSTDVDEDSRMARENCKQALDSDPTSSLALAIDGLVHTHVLHDLDTAYDRYQEAVHSNPNDPIAWLLKGALHAFRDEGDLAVGHTQRALSLSPLDPHRYYFESLAATAFLAARRYDMSLVFAQRSLRNNPAHTSTLRAKLISELNLGYERRAARTAEELLRLEPGFTVSGWKQRSPSAAFPIGSEWADALKGAGLPD